MSAVAHDPANYGDRIADLYDELYAGMSSAEAESALLAELAQPGNRALELGIGTGRIALPLAARGVEVHGVDASRAMVDRLRAKPGGDRLPVTVANFGDVDAVMGGPFSLVYCVFNTFFALLTHEDQVRCFQGVAARLGPTGRFVLEAFVPDMTRFSQGQAWRVLDVDAASSSPSVTLEASRHDPVAQRVDSNQVILREAGIRMIPIQIRYAYPAELDLMARVAGLRLADRWSGWRKQPFGRSSNVHVSVYVPRGL